MLYNAAKMRHQGTKKEGFILLIFAKSFHRGAHIAPSRRRPTLRALLLLRQRQRLRALEQLPRLCARGESVRERLDPRAQLRERLRPEGQARRAQQAALARQAAVDPRDPARGLERDRRRRLALDKGGVRR
jgi:hypothetical protein